MSVALRRITRRSLAPGLSKGRRVSIVTILVALLVLVGEAGAMAASTRLVKDLSESSSEPVGLRAFRGIVYFGFGGPEDSSPLARSDGTRAGTGLLGDLQVTTRVPSSQGQPALFHPIGRWVVFAAAEAHSPAHGFELWRTDGTTAGTELVKDIHPGGSSHPRWFARLNGELVFATDQGLWKTDGTEAGTTRVHGMSGQYLTRAKDRIYFAVGDAIWKTDGTEAGTKLVRDGLAFPRQLTKLGGTTFFTASDAGHGWELWKTDGTEAGTKLVRDIRPGPEGSIAQNLISLRGTLYFTAVDGVHGGELWRSDGTRRGTRLVRDLALGGRSGVGGSVKGALAKLGSSLYFSGHPKRGGFELWKSDGTAAGTRRVKDIAPGRPGSRPDELAAIGDVLYFSADDGVHGRELWSSTGTPGGTRLVKDINHDQGDSYPSWITGVGRKSVLFTAETRQLGNELWKHVP